MTTKIQYILVKSGSNTEIDLSDYVIDSGKIEALSLNNDKSPNITNLDFDLSSVSMYVPNIKDTIAVKVDGTVRHAYLVENTEYDYAKRTFKVKTKSKLSLLQDTLLDSKTLMKYISSTSDKSKYNPEEYTYGPAPDGKSVKVGNIQLLWLLQCMFNAANLSVDFSAISNQVMYSRFGFVKDDRPEYHDVKTTDLYVDKNMIFNVNQSVALSPYLLDADSQYSDRKISCWDFIAMTCSFFDWTVSNNSYAYRFVRRGSIGKPNVPNSARYVYKSTKELKKAESFKYSFQYYADPWILANDPYRQEKNYRAAYYNSKPLNLNWTEQNNPSGKAEDVKWYNNLTFYIRDMYTNASPNSLFEKRTLNILMGNVNSNLANSVTKDRNVEETETDIRFGDFDCTQISHDVKKLRTTFKTETIL